MTVTYLNNTMNKVDVTKMTFMEAYERIPSSDWLKLLLPYLVLLSLTYCYFYVATNTPKQRSRIVTWTVFWLILSGWIHSYIENLFVFYRKGWADVALDLYTASDFRYGYPIEAGTGAMEMITVCLDGPLCLLAAYAFIFEKKFYHPLVLVLCTMQLYGLLWFTLQPFFSSESHITKDPSLFWFICFGCNVPWSLFPGILFYKSFVHLSNLVSNGKEKAH